MRGDSDKRKKIKSGMKFPIKFAMKMAMKSTFGVVLNLTSAEYEALLVYEDRFYNVYGEGLYYGAESREKYAWTYEPADLHVSKTGNDTTGDGSLGNPYLTISKGFDVAVAANGGTVWVHEGTYAENVSGGYFLKSNVNPSSRVYIKARPDQSVVWSHASGVYLMRFNGTNSNITFKGFELVAANLLTAFFYNAGTDSVTGFEFIECTLTDDYASTRSFSISGSGGTMGVKIKRCTVDSTGNCSTLIQYQNGFVFVGNVYNCPNSTSSFMACRFNSGNTGSLYANSNAITGNNSSTSGAIAQDVALTNATLYAESNTINLTTGNGMRVIGGTLATPLALYLRNNHITAGGNGVRLYEHVNGGEITNNDIHAAGSSTLAAPEDGSQTGLVQNLTIEHNSLTATGGATNHTLLVGANSQSNTIRYNTIDGRLGAYGVVAKGTNNLYWYNTTYGGNKNAFYLKGSDGTDAQFNDIWQTVASVDGCLAAAVGTYGEIQQNSNFSNNTVHVTASGLYSIVEADLGDDNVFDINRYLVSGSGTWGSLLGTTCGSLADVRTAWDGYSLTNDENSTDI